MITLTLPNAFMLYLGFTLCILLFLWVYQSFLMRNKKNVPYERCLYQCEYCQEPYLEEALKTVTQCPLCQSFNKRESRL